MSGNASTVKSSASHGGTPPHDRARLAAVTLAMLVGPMLMMLALDRVWQNRSPGIVFLAAGVSIAATFAVAIAYSKGSFAARVQMALRLGAVVSPEMAGMGLAVVLATWVILLEDQPAELDATRAMLVWIAAACGLMPLYVGSLALFAERRGVALERVASGTSTSGDVLVPLAVSDAIKALQPEVLSHLDAEARITDGETHWAEARSASADGAECVQFLNLAAAGKSFFTTSEQLTSVDLVFSPMQDSSGISRLALRLRGVGRLAGAFATVSLAHQEQQLASWLEQRIATLLTERELHWRNERLERLATEAELKALQAQVEPHFLFNTLASLRRLISTEPIAAEAMLDNLVTYLRNAMPDMRAQLSTVGRELKLAESYLAIMRVRMGAERLDYAIHCPVEFQEHPFPPAMLISLVENAVKHGLQKSMLDGRIHVLVERRDDAIVAIVQDNGVGLSAVSGTGVGLMNIRQRLEALYGRRAQLFAAAREPAGFESSISIPQGA